MKRVKLTTSQRATIRRVVKTGKPANIRIKKSQLSKDGVELDIPRIRKVMIVTINPMQGQGILSFLSSIGKVIARNVPKAVNYAKNIITKLPLKSIGKAVAEGVASSGASFATDSIIKKVMGKQPEPQVKPIDEPQTGQGYVFAKDAPQRIKHKKKPIKRVVDISSDTLADYIAKNYVKGKIDRIEFKKQLLPEIAKMEKQLRTPKKLYGSFKTVDLS